MRAVERWGPPVAGIAAVVLVVLGINAAPAVAGHLMHPRDVERFNAYVGEWADPATWGSVPPGDSVVIARDGAWIAAHPDELLAAGDRACDWLDAQPKAPDVVPTGGFDSGSLETAYLGVHYNLFTTAPADPAAGDSGLTMISNGARHTVVAGAWENLCWSTRESRTAPMSLYDD